MTEFNGRDSERRWGRLRLIATLRSWRVLPYLLVVVAWSVVDIIPIVSNDGLGYLFHADSLRSEGLVRSGYRLAGYPFLIRIADTVGGLLGYDGLFSIVLLQRLLVLGFGLWLARRHRWKGAVFFVVLFSSRFLANTNFLLTDSLAIGLAGVLAAVFVRSYEDLPTDRKRPALWTLAIVVVLSTIRQHYLVFWILPAYLFFGFIWAGRMKYALRYATACAVGLTLIGLFYWGVTQENSTEIGIASPLADTERTDYWAAWTTVFRLEGLPPENALKPFYDENNPYTFIREVDALPNPHDRVSAFETQVESLLRASELSRRKLTVSAFLGSLHGGRIEDLRGMKTQLLSAGIDDRLAATYSNGSASRGGREAFLLEFNDGQQPDVMIVSSLVSWWPRLPEATTGLIVPVLLLITPIVAWLRAGPGRRLRLLGLTLISAMPHLAVSAAASSILGDNHRFLAPTFTFTAVALFLIVMMARPGNGTLIPTSTGELDATGERLS